MAKAKVKEKPANGQTAEVIEETAVLAPIPDYDWSQMIVSPLKRYPGTVAFPEHFTMQHFRAWKEVNDALHKQDENGEPFRALSMGYTNGRRLAQFDCRQWAHVLSMADIRLENLPAAALTDSSGESTPIEVLAWLIPLTLDVYLAEKLNLKN